MSVTVISKKVTKRLKNKIYQKKKRKEKKTYSFIILVTN